MNNMKEMWKDVPEYEGLYQVSNLGKVKSLDRYIETPIKKYLLKSRVLKPGKNIQGHFYVNLYKNKKPKSRTIHQLVAICFLDHVACGYKFIVDHIDNDKNNNHVDNLQVTTQRYNLSKDKKNTTSQYTGVTWHKSHKKWMASIRIGKSRKYLGYFKDDYDAHLAYQKELNSI
jgi:hypothetical protein